MAVCFACTGGSRQLLPKYEHDGAIDTFHPTCVGSWLTQHPDSVINFYIGDEEARNKL